MQGCSGSKTQTCWYTLHLHLSSWRTSYLYTPLLSPSLDPILFRQVRLHSVPPGSAESLRLSYKTAFGRLVPGYTAYLHRTIQETPAPRRPRAGTAGGSGQTDTLVRTNRTCSSNHIFNDSLINTSTDKFNETATPNSTADIGRGCKTDGSIEDFGLDGSKRRNKTTEVLVNRKTLGDTIGRQGLLVIEPGRNVSHMVQHHPCESPAIQQALVTRIINAQDLERNRYFFLYPEKFFNGLLRQKEVFELKTN